MDVFNSIVYSAVEFSNLLSCLAVLSCTGAVFMFLMNYVIGHNYIDNVVNIADLIGERRNSSLHSSSSPSRRATIAILAQREETLRPTTTFSQNALQVPRLNMTRVHIPFTFRLVEAGNQAEIQIVVTSQVKYTIQGFWGVSIRDLHMFLWKPWIELKEHAYSLDGTILNKSFYQQLAIDVRNKDPHSGDEQITLTSPKPPMMLGAPPRLAYPLVLFLIRDSESNIMNMDDTALLVNVIHLKDPICPLPTSILAQYLKQASGQLSCLKQLYLATGDSLSSDESTTVPSSSLSLAEPVACAGSSVPLLCSDGPQTEQLCVVCHYFPLSRALLPCRHTCICAVCFSKLTRCPMCRAPISSYFCIRTEEYIPPGIFEQKSTKTKNIHWLDALNDRLTDFLGFR